ncbi:hypothetical protein ACVW00_000233 [Marmoricola sp. URHA0025 HA25]
MMNDIVVTSRITPDHLGSLVTVYERTPDRTTPAAGLRDHFHTTGMTP